MGENENRILEIVKAKFGLKNKTQALALILKTFEQQMLEAELRPEYLKKLKIIDKEKAIPFKSIEELRNIIED